MSSSPVYRKEIQRRLQSYHRRGVWIKNNQRGK
uniref:Uncharacterized protein n=1 Tax=Anguilla anguilla TaxID=7936 RepID=A0A0E9TEH2_ANGAN